MEDVLKKVATLSITGGNGMIRVHCRQVLMTWFIGVLACSCSIFLTVEDIKTIPLKT